MHTTNYYDTLIEVAPDCKLAQAQVPELRNGKRTIALMQFELIAKNPYTYTSDDILFQVYADRNDLLPDEFEAARKQFFSKGQACMRASPLTKQFGWGVHFDKDGKAALCGMETDEYQRILGDPAVKKVKAMRTSK